MNEIYKRKMASIQEVNGVYPIEGADRICQYGINGWRVIDQVGKYKVGDLVVYCEIDSWIPNEVAPFLTKPDKEPKEYNTVRGERLKTIRLKKALSQGLIIPISELYKSSIGFDNSIFVNAEFIDTDVSDILDIQKWEPPPEFTSADAKGLFPWFIPKTDQERVQNCFRNLEPLLDDTSWELSEKVEGQSHTTYYYNGDVGVCSRNLDLKDADNTFWNTARKYNIIEKLISLGRNIAIQSEQVGPGISGNIYGLKEYYLFVFDVYDIDKQEYLDPSERRQLVKELGLVDAPVIDSNFSLKGYTLDDILEMADGKSVLGSVSTLREGFVFKANSKTRVSFKAVSNKYLEVHK